MQSPVKDVSLKTECDVERSGREKVIIHRDP